MVTVGQVILGLAVVGYVMRLLGWQTAVDYLPLIAAGAVGAGFWAFGATRNKPDVSSSQEAAEKRRQSDAFMRRETPRPSTDGEKK